MNSLACGAGLTSRSSPAGANEKGGDHQRGKIRKTLARRYRNLGFSWRNSAGSSRVPEPISTCPYTITTSGNYVLTRDLTISGGCIGITADNVALDLQGHSITGDGVNGVGIGTGSSGNNHIIMPTAQCRNLTLVSFWLGGAIASTA
jgi:hypothetical protein